MKLKSITFTILVLGFLALMASCDDDEGTTPNEEEEEMTSAPNGWVLVEADSFFVASASALPGGFGPYRYQVNFASRAQLNQQGNDGETESTFAIQFAFASRPMATGTYNFTSDRFNLGASDINLYQTFFVNTGHPKADNNYLSPEGASVEITIADGKLVSSLDQLTMTNEGDASDSYNLKWSLNLDW